jgi:signal transduction histidine kinase
MLSENQNRECVDYLNNLAYLTSHRIRRPIATMSGLIELMRLNLLGKQEHEKAISDFKICLDELDHYSRELGDLIHNEQESLHR